MTQRLQWLLGVAALLVTTPAPADPTKDECVAASETGQDLRRAGKVKSAAERFRLCTNSSCPAIVRDDCAKRLEETERSLATIAFTVRDNRGTAVPNVKASMDGAPFELSSQDGSSNVDLGDHVFELAAPGFGKVTRKLAVREGAKLRVDIALSEDPSAAGRSADPSGLSQRTVAYILGGLGIVGVGIGAVFGLNAKSTYEEAFEKHCQSSSAKCTDPGVKGGADAHEQATISTVAFLAGGLLLAGGVALFITAPKPSGAGVALAPNHLRLTAVW